MLYQASNSNSAWPHGQSRFSRLVRIRLVMFKHSDWLQITQRLIQINSNDPLVNLLHTFLVSKVAAFSDNFTRRAGCLCPRSTLIRTLLSLSLTLIAYHSLTVFYLQQRSNAEKLPVCLVGAYFTSQEGSINQKYFPRISPLSPLSHSVSLSVQVLGRYSR